MTHQSHPPTLRIPHHRLLIACIVLVIWVVITVGGGVLITGGQGSLDDLVTHQVGVHFVVAVVLVLGVVVALRWQHVVALKPADPRRSWRVLWLPAVVISGFLAFTIVLGVPPVSITVFVLINTLLVGISEEVMFRGIMFQGLLSRMSIWPAILVTSLVFGAVHALNGLITGDFGAAVTQAVAASLSGLWLLAVRVRTHSLYPAVVIHWFWDFAVFLFGLAVTAQRSTSSIPTPSFAQGFLGSIGLVLPLALYGVWLLRGIGTHTKADVLS